MTEFTSLFAAAVRAKRRHAGLSQEDLAEKAGCSTDTIGNIERGEVSPSIDVFVSLTKVLSIDVRPLLAVESPDRRPSKDRVRLESDMLVLAGQMTDARLMIFIEMGRLLQKA